MRPSIDVSARSTLLLTLLLSALAGLRPAVPLLAADGDLDPSFWADGKVQLGTTGTYDVGEVLEAPDGRIVVVGTRTDSEGVEEWYWRALGDSAAGSTCFFLPPGGATAGVANAAAFDEAGRLVVAGSARYGSNRAAVARFDYPDCALNASFDGDGFYTLDVAGGTEVLTAIAISANGWLTLGGSHHDGTDADVLVIRLNDAGQPVTQFSGDGWLKFDVTGAELDDGIQGIAVDAQGRVVTGGNTYYGADGSNSDFIALRYTPTGVLDTTFDGDGIARVAWDLGGSEQRWDQALALALDPTSGAILLAGWAQTIGTRDLAVARLTPAGTLDPTFSGDGKWNQNFSMSQLRVRNLVVDGLGRITMAGEAIAFVGSAGRDFFVARLTPTGGTDTSFSGNGWAKVPFDVGPPNYVDDSGAAATFASGRLVVAGEVTRNTENEDSFGVLRFQVGLIFADGFSLGHTREWSESLDGNPL